MKNRIIRAVSGNHALLRNGQVPIIGFMCDKLRYTGTGCAVPTEVCFILYCGKRKFKDYFYFENNTLVYQVVSIKREEDQYLAEVYNECAKEAITPEEFIFRVTDAYVNHEMGSD